MGAAGASISTVSLAPRQRLARILTGKDPSVMETYTESSVHLTYKYCTVCSYL